MTWLILLIGVPAIIVPVVLLCGFAGCGLNVKGSGIPAETPDVPKAFLGGDRRSVEFSWLPRGGSADSFNIVRTDSKGNVADFTTPGAQSTLIDTSNDLAAGMTFDYRVAAVSFGTATPLTNPRKVTIPPAAPALTAALSSPTVVSLTWTSSANATKYRVEHLPDLTVVYSGPATTASHAITPGTTHSYRVFATVAGGFNDSQIKDVDSDPSATAVVVAAGAANWTTVFTTAGIAASPATGQNEAGNCIVQRVPAPAGNAAQVRVTLRAVQNQPTALTAVTISKAAAAGSAQPQNSLDLPVDLKFGGATGVTIPAGTTRTSDPLGYAIVAGQDLHVAFNVSAASGRILRRNVANTVSYSRDNAADAASQNRPGYNPNTNDVYCVETVEIA